MAKPYMRRSAARHARIAPADLPEHHAVPVEGEERHEHEQQQENARSVDLPEILEAFKESAAATAESESRLGNVLRRARWRKARCRKSRPLDGFRHERSKDQHRDRAGHGPRNRLDEHPVHLLDIHPVPPE